MNMISVLSKKIYFSKSHFDTLNATSNDNDYNIVYRCHLAVITDLGRDKYLIGNDCLNY